MKPSGWTAQSAWRRAKLTQAFQTLETAGKIQTRTGPLKGIRIIEMAGIGPVPLAGLMLAELGADVLRIERTSANQAFLRAAAQFDLSRHGRTVLKLDLKSADGCGLLLRLCDSADVLIEGYRPGVMERLGLGPNECRKRNPQLIYGRMTGFGRDAPLSGRAGHDLTYLALTGILHAIGNKGGRPVPPLNLVADYGGGTMFLLTGILSALIERAQSGQGQIVDATMTDGAAMLAAPLSGYLADGLWREERGTNLLDSGAPFYDTYETSDARHVAVACLEPQFFAEFARLLPMDSKFASRQYDEEVWPSMRQAIAARIADRTMDEWWRHFRRSDACVAPVLSWSEAAEFSHNKARRAHIREGSLTRPKPAPDFSRTPQSICTQTLGGKEEAMAALERFGVSVTFAQGLFEAGILVE